jgi:hypothetical protein
MTATAKFNERQQDKILALMDQIGGDGHGVYDPSILSAFPDALQKRFTYKIKSDTSCWKSTLYDAAGKVIEEITAVYSLSVHEGICADLGIDAGSYSGRGFRAQACCAAIKKFFGGKQD